MLIGTWKNIDELEQSLCLAELEAIIKAARDKEYRHHQFLASLKGINLDETVNGKEKWEEIERRAQARLRGEEYTETDKEKDEFLDLGFEVESD